MKDDAHRPADESSESTGAIAERIVAACLEAIDADVDRRLADLRAVQTDDAVAVRNAVEAVTAGLRPAPTASEHGRLGPYELVRELGRGGQGLVYLATDARLGRVVALKVLKGFGPLSEKLMQRFKREAEVTSRLDNVGICPVYDAGTIDGIPFIAMRYIQGTTLAQGIRAARIAATPEPSIESFLDLEDLSATTDDAGDAPSTSDTDASTSLDKQDVLRVIGIIEHVARTLHAAHEAGIVHRDVKPGNIMVTPNGTPVILDFGLAGEEANDLALTQTGDVFGTPAYMSPEQIEAHAARPDRRTDIFSLGVTLFECLALRRPFEAPTRHGLYEAIKHAAPPDLRRLNRRVPRDVRLVLDKALEKDRDRRYATALDFAEDLRRVRAKQPVVATRVSPAGRLLRWMKRRPFRAALAATLALGTPAVAAAASYIVAKQPDVEQARAQRIRNRVEGHLEDGFDELAHGDPARAIAFFGEARTLKPDSEEAVSGTALALQRQEDWPACLALLEDAGRQFPSARWVAALRADCRAAQSNTAQAEVPATDARSTTPIGAFIDGWRFVLGCRRHQDPARFRRANDHFTAAALRTTNARLLYHCQLAHVAYHLRVPSEARRAADALIALWPDSPHALRWATDAARIYDRTHAVEIARRAVAVSPNDAAAHAALGRQLEHADALDEAVDAFRASLALAPTPECQHRIAIIRAKQRRPDDAFAELDRAIAMAPKHAEFHRTRGSFLVDGGRIDDALRAYRHAVSLAPDDPLNHRELAVGLNRAGRFEESLAAFKRTLAMAPNLFSAHEGIASTLLMLRRGNEALVHARRAVQLRPHDAESHRMLGICLSGTGDLDGAIDAYEQALVCAPRHVECLVNLGSTLARAGRLDAAIDALEDALDLNPKELMALTNLGHAYAAKGDLDAAIGAFERFIEIQPRAPTPYRALADFLKRRGDHGRALDAYRRCHALGSPHPKWPYPSAQWIKSQEALVVREAGRRLTQGGDSRKTAGEWLDVLLDGWNDDTNLRDHRDALRLLARLVRSAPVRALRTELESNADAERIAWGKRFDRIGALLKRARK